MKIIFIKNVERKTFSCYYVNVFRSRKNIINNRLRKICCKRGGINLFKQLQKIGKSFMLPIAILPAAGLLLGIGGALSEPNTVQAYPFLNIWWLQGIFSIMSSAGNVIFSNLA